MESGLLVAIFVLLLFSSLCFPWLAAVHYKYQRTPKASREAKAVAENANNYRRFGEYTILIVCYAILIAAYVIAIDHVTNHPDYLGEDPQTHNHNFEILSFIQTGFTVIHLPLLTGVLAATIPYWTMAKPHRVPQETGGPLDVKNTSNQLEQRTRVTQLFYLADRTWAGLIGWTTALIFGWKDRAFSYIWAQLAVIAGLAYIGFPLLSLAYVTKNTQYWDPSSMSATVDVGGMSQSYSNALEAMQNVNIWMEKETFLNSSLNLNLVGFNSSNNLSTSNASAPLSGIENLWADNQTFTTATLAKKEDDQHNIQLPVAGIKAFSSCRRETYNLTEPGELNDTVTTAIPNLVIEQASYDNDNNSFYTLSCANDCSNQGNSSSLACSMRSSMVNITSFDYHNKSGYLVDEHEYTHHYTFSNVGSTTAQQTLSCIQQDYSNLQSIATVLLAVQGANDTAQVATCNLSLTYMQPTVNTLLGQYIDSTGLSSANSGLNATPAEFLNLSMASFVHFFHQGPPILTYPPAPAHSSLPNCTLPPISNGFEWISDWAPLCYLSQLPTVVTNQSDPTILLQQPFSDYVVGLSSFDERMFLGPLASFINDRSFFRNGTVIGVTFKVENGFAYGRVPAALAMVVLAIPILWTVGLSVIANSRRRWTASLDAFAVFKLGADWHGDLQDLRLVSLGKANERVMSIPGTVVVDPEAGMAELANAPPRRRLSRKSRRRGWRERLASAS